MALAVSLRKWHDIYMGDQRLVVSHIHGPTSFNVRREDGKVFHLGPDSWDEVLPGVFMQAGIPRGSGSNSMVVVLIDAPGVIVLRGELYRKTNPSSCPTCKGKRELSYNELCPTCKGSGCYLCTRGFTLVKFVCPDCSTEGVGNETV